MKIGRRKGFPVQLQKLHWFSVLAAYDYCRVNNLNTEDMDAAVTRIPGSLRPKAEDVEKAIHDNNAVTNIYGYTERLYTDRKFSGSKTVRFRATEVAGAIELLKAAAYLTPHGQAGNTIARRIESLESIDPLDLVTDSGR